MRPWRPPPPNSAAQTCSRTSPRDPAAHHGRPMAPAAPVFNRSLRPPGCWIGARTHGAGILGAGTRGAGAHRAQAQHATVCWRRMPAIASSRVCRADGLRCAPCATMTLQTAITARRLQGGPEPPFAQRSVAAAAPSSRCMPQSTAHSAAATEIRPSALLPYCSQRHIWSECRRVRDHRRPVPGNAHRACVLILKTHPTPSA